MTHDRVRDNGRSGGQRRISQAGARDKYGKSCGFGSRWGRTGLGPAGEVEAGVWGGGSLGIPRTGRVIATARSLLLGFDLLPAEEAAGQGAEDDRVGREDQQRR